MPQPTPSLYAANAAPAEIAVAITTSDVTDFVDGPCRAIYTGSGGTIVAVVAGTAVTFTNTPGGGILPIRASRINATNTLATGLIALY